MDERRRGARRRGYATRTGANGRFDVFATEVVNRVAAAFLLVALAPLLMILAITIPLDSRGPVFFRCRRIGRGGREFAMLKFRKMYVGATGIALTASRDARLTRLGRFLAKTKLDEVPQLWNVLLGHMSLVGPRPEDPEFVRLQAEAFAEIHTVKPGITGLSQLAFARESEILNQEDPVADYLDRLLPQKLHLDRSYAAERSISMDMRILFWTLMAVVFRRDVAVHRDSCRLNVRRRTAPVAAAEVAHT